MSNTNITNKKKKMDVHDFIEDDDNGYLAKNFMPKKEYYHNIGCDNKKVKRYLK